MKAIIDTHVALWSALDDPLLPPKWRSLLLNPDNEVLLSVASLWEIAIKHSKGKLDLGCTFAELLDRFDRSGFSMLPITTDHLIALDQLPEDSHKDPFDRLIIAQCLTEGLPVLSVDKQFEEYGVVIVER